MFWTALVPLLLVKSAAPCKLPSVQKPAVASAVSIAGDVAKPFAVAARDTEGLEPVHSEVRQPSDAGPIEGDFEGVSIAGLLERAGATAKATKAGLVDSVIVARAPINEPSSASEPYEVTLSYAEVSPRLSRNPAFLAFRCNGVAITPTLVVPNDLTDVRYVHELSSLTFRVIK